MVRFFYLNFIASVLVGLFSVTSAQAITLNFSNGTYAQTPTAQTYTEAGFTFTTGVGNHFDSNGFPANTVFPGGIPSLVFHEAANNRTNNRVVLTFGGAAFDFLGFDLVSDARVLARNPRINPVMSVTGSNGSTFNTPAGSGAGFVGTVSASMLGVTSVAFDILSNTTLAGNVIMDNVVVRPSGVQPPVNPIPIPPTFLLLASVVGLIGFRFRNSRSHQ